MRDYKDMAIALQAVMAEVGKTKAQLEDETDDARFVNVEKMGAVIRHIMESIETENLQNTPITKFLFIEDGSVDKDDLITSLANSNPEISVVVYRQGSARPVLIDKDGQD